MMWNQTIRHLLRRVLTGILVVWGAIVVLFLMGNFLGRDSVPVVIVMNHVAHWVTLINLLVFALAFALHASPRLLLWLAPGVIAFVGWFAPAWLPKSTPEVEGIEFTAATFNVLGFLADPDETFAVIQEMDADIVALQELRPTLQGKLKNELAEMYPYQASKVVQGYDGFALLSRFPIIEHKIVIEVDFDDIDLNELKYLRAVLDIEGQQVVVYTIHPPIPSTNPYANPIYEMLLEYDDHYLQSHIEQTVALIEAETLPVLLLCDCNSTRRSRQYRLLDTILDDAFGAQGWGLGLTYPTDPFPLFRIDYIWHSAEFTAVDAGVWAEGGTSDHLPVWGKLVLRKK